MKKNVIPFALIAVLGIALVIIMSNIGIHQQETIQQDQSTDNTSTNEQANNNNDKGDTDENGGTVEPEDIFKQNCAACHGEDLSGNIGPNLQKVGGELSEDEIADIVKNGKSGDIGTMPANILSSQDEIDAVAEWLSKKK